MLIKNERTSEHARAEVGQRPARRGILGLQTEYEGSVLRPGRRQKPQRGRLKQPTRAHTQATPVHCTTNHRTKRAATAKRKAQAPMERKGRTSVCAVSSASVHVNAPSVIDSDGEPILRGPVISTTS